MKESRVYLRILELSDISTTQQWINDPEISQIMGYLPVKSLKQQEKWYLSGVDDNSRYIFAICLRENETHIGNVGLGNIDYISRNAQLSIFIYDDKYRTQGYGTEATKLILDFAFNRLNMHKIYLRTSPHFKNAIAMYEKIGFVKEGVLRQHYFDNGKYTDKLMFSILQEEFLSQKLAKLN
jgi:RimJ/RimL family protein N-acetyltransferase